MHLRAHDFEKTLKFYKAVFAVLDIPITAAQVFESNVLLGGGAGSTANVAIDQLGYVEDVEALP